MNFGRRITFIILVVLAIMGFTQMISGLSDVDFIEHINSSQKYPDFKLFTLLGSVAIVAILMDFGREFLNRIKETRLKSALELGLSCAIVTIIFMVTPMRDFELPEQKMIMTGIALAVIVTVHIIGYIWGKRHGSDENNNEDGGNEE